MLADSSCDIQHPDLTFVVDQLKQVPVAGNNIHRHRCGARECPDHIIGLITVLAHHGNPQSIQDRQDQRDLYGEPFWSSLGGGARRAGHLGNDIVARLRDPMSLVGRDQIHPPLGTPVVVPAARQMGRRVGIEQSADEVKQPTQRIDRSAVWTTK